MIREMWEDGWVGRTLLLFLTLMTLAIPLLVWAMVVENRDWEKFKVAHACKIVGRISGSTGTGVGTVVSPGGGVGVGPVVVSVPGKTGWLCDDGITYWR